MNSSELRQKLHEYIDNTDENLLTEVYKMIAEEDLPYNYSAKEIETFYHRRDAFIKGKGKDYTVEESLNNIRS